MTVTLGECLLASVLILDLHLRFRMYHQINLFTAMFYDKRRKRQCIEQRSAASIRQYITNVVINIVFYANSIRRSATLANFATRSSTDSCCSQQMLTSMIPTFLMHGGSLFVLYVRQLRESSLNRGCSHWQSHCNFVQQT